MTDLSDTQRERIIDDVIDYRRQRARLTEHKEEYTVDEHDRDTAYLSDLSDDDLLEFWDGLIGERLNELVDSQPDSEFAAAWETADVTGIATPADWQLDKLIAGDETDYTLRPLLDFIEHAVETVGTITVASKNILLGLVDMSTDEDGYIIDEETGEFKIPYSFDSHGDRTFKPFREIAHDSEDDPLDERLADMRKETGDHHKHRADRIHIDDFGGIIHKGALPETDTDQILRDNWFEMLDIAKADALTANIKGIDGKTPVLTTVDLYKEYEDYAGSFE